MPNAVISLEGSLYLTDPQSIIAYQIRRYFRQPADTIPYISDQIISLPLQVARFGREPDSLASNMQADLQGVFNRIFSGERKITVSVIPVLLTTITYNLTISVMYTLLNGELDQTGITVSVENGELRIPEDTISGLLTAA